MTNEEIAKLAHDAGYYVYESQGVTLIESDDIDKFAQLVRFAEFATAAEREACAVECERIKSNWNYCADAIRARSTD